MKKTVDHAAIVQAGFNAIYPQRALDCLVARLAFHMPSQRLGHKQACPLMALQLVSAPMVLAHGLHGLHGLQSIQGPTVCCVLESHPPDMSS